MLVIPFHLQAIDIGLVVKHSFTLNAPLTPDNSTSSSPAAGEAYLEPFDPDYALSNYLLDGRFGSEQKRALAARVPIQSLYNHLIIYLFLPIPRKWVAVAFGLTTSLVCILLFRIIELVAVSVNL